MLEWLSTVITSTLVYHSTPLILVNALAVTLQTQLYLSSKYNLTLAKKMLGKISLLIGVIKKLFLNWQELKELMEFYCVLF